MDARLDTLSTEMYQMNVRVSRIAWRQATIDGFAPKATPSPHFPMASDSEDEDASDDADGDASSTDEMSTWHSYNLSLWQKGRVVLDMRVVFLRGRVSIGLFLLKGVFVHMFFWEM